MTDTQLMSKLVLEDGVYRLELPLHPDASFALGEDRLKVIFDQMMINANNQVANRLLFARAGSMRYPGCHTDVAFDCMGVAV